MFGNIIDKYKEKELYNEDYAQDESDKRIDKHFLTLEQFYEQKLEKPVNMIQEVIKQQVKILFKNNIESLCEILNNEINESSN